MNRCVRGEVQDRIKEYGKRYLQPAAEWFGFEFPDRTVKARLLPVTRRRCHGASTVA